MISELLVKAGDLAAWADQHSAKERFPELVRRLCFATAKDPLRIEFASAKLHGFDGVVEAGDTNPPIHQGVSVWELSTEQSPGSKAKKDFDKRTAKPGPFDPTQTTYVAVSLRHWDNKDSTVQEWQQSGPWQRVVAVDATSLESWLHRAPAVHLWVSQLLKKHPLDASDIESYWKNWADSSGPAVTPALMQVGYEEQSTDLLTRLAERASVIKIRAESQDLARAFAASVLATGVGDVAERLAARCVVVNTPSAFKELATQFEGLILIPVFEPADLVGMALSRGHFVIQSLGQEDNADGQTISLKRRHANILEPALKEMYPDDPNTYRMAERASSSLVAFRRSILHAATLPDWASPGPAETLLAALLVGGWDESYAGDRECVALLAQEDYATWLKSIGPWLNRSDSPLRQSDSVYRLVDRRDSWDSLSPRLRDANLAILETVVLKAFSEADARWDPDENVRKRARLFPDKAGVSPHLKIGLTDTLAILGALGSTVNTDGQRLGDISSHVIVRKLLESVSTPQQLCAISPAFQSIAEAYPDGFLSWIEGLIKTRPEDMKALFQDAGADFFSDSSPHTTLLWALEILAWDPNLLTRVALILAALSIIDPGGRLGNRPPKALREVFLAWSPGTMASVAERLDSIGRMRVKYPQAAWNLMIQLLPSDHDVSHPTSEAKYRLWGRLWAADVTYGDIYESTLRLSGWLVEDAKNDTSRWISLIDNFPRLDPRVQGDFLSGIEAMAKAASELEKEQLWKHLRDLISHHARFPKSDWSLPGERLDVLRNLEVALEPADRRKGFAWLFEQWPDLPEEYEDFDRHDEKVRKLRDDAVNQILGAGESDAFMSFTDVAPHAGVWGHSVGLNRQLEDEQTLLGDHLKLGASATETAMRGYILGRREILGNGWLVDLLDQPWTSKAGDEFRATLYWALPMSDDTLDRLAQESSATQERYWNVQSGNSGLIVNPEILPRVVEELLRHKAYSTAIKTLGFARGDRRIGVSPELALRALEGAINETGQGRDVPWQQLGHDLSEILTFLEDADVSLEPRIAGIELLFAHFLSHTRKPHVLQRIIRREPDTLVSLLKAAYKDEDGNSEVGDGVETVQPELAYEILHALGDVPGQNGTVISEEGLSEWVSEAGRLASEAKRTRVFHAVLGDWLSHTPVGADGIWPQDAVCRVIDDLESESLENSFEVGIMNSRGVFTKRLGEGGDQERSLAAKYRAWQAAIRSKWPRTAKALGSVADSYEHRAVREDRDRD